MNPKNQSSWVSLPPKRLTQAENRKFRRESLLRAAIVTVAQFDIAGATVERICAQAGASRGLIAHYFENKEELLLAALAHWFDTALFIKRQIADDASLSAYQRIKQVAYASFSSPSYSWETAAAWQAFTNASRYNQRYAEPIYRASRNTHALLEWLFAQAAQDRHLKIDARKAAVGLYILDDGLWNSLATGKDNLTLSQATEYCDGYIDGWLAVNKVSCPDEPAR